ncbi:MAG: 4Fe-4S dicluster domain-containing protein, partial [Desulfobacterales bacterium]
CVEKCQVEAVSMNDAQIAVVDSSRCIGCGACANLCPTEAISMALHPQVPSPPGTARDLRQAILQGIQNAVAE